MQDESQAKCFLSQYFGKMQESYLLLWTKQDRRSQSFKLPAEIKKAAAMAVSLAKQKKDVYFGVTPSKVPYSGSSGRGKAEDATALTALWADVDLASGVHSAQSNNPPDVATVKRLLQNHKLPSIAVQSGGGLHLYWLLDEPVPITDDESRRKAAELAESWQQSIRRAFAEHGYTLDATADLARLLRVPGTFNYKSPSEPKPVIMIDSFNAQEE